jgi:hypothetical protein
VEPTELYNNCNFTYLFTNVIWFVIHCENPFNVTYISAPEDGQ